MGRKWFMAGHAICFVVAGVLYFFFVLPRWHELMGETAHSLGTAMRIATGVLIALAALPVVFILLRSRKPELGTPQLALSLRVRSIAAHVLAGVLIIGAAISEIWLSLDAAGQYLFAIYAAAAAIAVLGLFAFYLSFVAELPPPPPKPIKAKKPKERRGRRKKGDEAQDETDEAEEAADVDETPEADEPAEVTAETPEADEPAEVTAETTESVATVEPPAEPETPEAPTDEDAAAQAPDAEDDDEEPKTGLRNRRPTGKGSHRMRRRRTRGGVAVEEE